MFESTIRGDVLQVSAPGARWLSTGFDGGLTRADAAYNLTVPEGFDRTDLAAYVEERRRGAGFDGAGPALLTGVSMEHARGARSGDVVAYATVGLSNPAVLPLDPVGGPEPTGDVDTTTQPVRRDGTVNLLLGTTRAVDDGALANLLAVAVEAKAATLLAETASDGTIGFAGTTTDAAVVGCAPDGEPATFTGSGTPIGADTRACVREAVRASLRSRRSEVEPPDTAADAEHGVRTDRRAEVFRV